MSAKLSVTRVYEVGNRIVAVPRSWGRGSVAEWQTKAEKREFEEDDVSVISLSDKREFGEGLLPICKKIEMEDFTVDDLPFELV